LNAIATRTEVFTKSAIFTAENARAGMELRDELAIDAKPAFMDSPIKDAKVIFF
jgi:hypothetical protein